MNQDEALTAEEVAKLLKVSRGTVYSLKDKGELSSFLVGRKLRFTRKAVQAYIERNQPESENQVQAVPIATTAHQSDSFVICGQDIMGMLTFFQPRTSYAASPSDFLYCTGLIPPNDSFIRSSLYQRI